MQKIIETCQSEIDAKIKSYNALLNEGSMKTMQQLNAEMDQIKEQIEAAMNAFQMQLNATDSSDARVRLDDSTLKLTQALNAQAMQIKKQVDERNEQILVEQKEAMESIEYAQKELELIKVISEVEEENDFDKVFKFIDSREKKEISISLIHKYEELENFFRRYLPWRQNDYVKGVTAFTFGIAVAVSIFPFGPFGLTAILTLGSKWAMIIAGSVTGGVTMLSTIIAYFAAYISVHGSKFKNLSDALKKTNDARKERDDLKSKEANDPLSESYPLSEILENSDRDPCVPEQI
jgi:hypothetical protein